MRIFVIDENDLERRIIGDFLSDLGHEIQRFDCASAMLRHLGEANETADLVIIDGGMGKKTSAQAVERVHDLLPECEIILTCRGEEVLAAKDAVSFGVHSYLIKPLRLAELELMVARVREKRGIEE